LSRVPAVVIGCGVAVLILWPLFTGYVIRPFLGSKSPHRARIVISYVFSWLILAWVVFKSIKAVMCTSHRSNVGEVLLGLAE
jgi:hypothetical protein